MVCIIGTISTKHHHIALKLLRINLIQKADLHMEKVRLKKYGRTQSMLTAMYMISLERLLLGIEASNEKDNGIWDIYLGRNTRRYMICI